VKHQLQAPGAAGARTLLITLGLLWFCLYRAAVAAVDIEINGLPDDIAERVRNSIRIENGREDETVDRSEAARRMARGRQQLRRSLTAFGYYRAEVSAELQGEPDNWKAIYRVTPASP
jgi:hypothetical protein